MVIWYYHILSIIDVLPSGYLLQFAMEAMTHL